MDFFNIHKKLIITISISLVLLILIISLIFNSYQVDEVQPPTLINQELTQNETSNKVYIDIKGEVLHPGVYQVEENIIIQEAIQLAGGLTKNADTSSINLASKISEGMLIIIPSKSSKNQSSIKNNKVSLNYATQSELQTIPGLGPSKAQKIIEYRNTYGLFKSVEEIKNVSGIGDSTYEKIKNYLTL